MPKSAVNPGACATIKKMRAEIVCHCSYTPEENWSAVVVCPDGTEGTVTGASAQEVCDLGYQLAVDTYDETVGVLFKYTPDAWKRAVLEEAQEHDRQQRALISEMRAIMFTDGPAVTDVADSAAATPVTDESLPPAGA